MKSYLELVQETLVAPTKVYLDKDGNFAGQQTDIYPAMRLVIRTLAWAYCIKWITWVLWAPFGYWVVRWWCDRNDRVRMKADPVGWPERKKKLLLEFKLWMYLWIGFIIYGYLTDWGA